MKRKLLKDRSTESLIRSLLLRKKQFPYHYYTPNGKCEEFIKLVGSDEVFVSVISAANGVGKTAVGSNIVANICYPTKNPFFKGLPIFEEFPYPKRGRIVSDATTISRTLIPELHRWLPKGKYESRKIGKMYEYSWRTDTGFTFDVMTYDQAPKEFESATLGWAWFDEPPPFMIYKATVARMRLGGLIFITQTPLTGSAWMFDNLVASPDRVDVGPILKKYKLKEWNEPTKEEWIKRFSKMSTEERLGL